MYSTLPIRNLVIEENGDFFNHHMNHNLQASLSVDGTNLPGDSCLVLSTDPKPRLRWTTELHERFVDAVTQLGGPESKYSSFICILFTRYDLCVTFHFSITNLSKKKV